MTEIHQILMNLEKLTDAEKLQYLNFLINHLQHKTAVIQSKLSGEFLEIVNEQVSS